jgi:hypothetical protein
VCGLLFFFAYQFSLGSCRCFFIFCFLFAQSHGYIRLTKLVYHSDKTQLPSAASLLTGVRVSREAPPGFSLAPPPAVVRMIREGRARITHTRRAPAAKGGGPQQFGSQQFGSQQFGSQQLGSQQFGSQQFGSQQFGSQKYGSQKFGSRGPAAAAAKMSSGTIAADETSYASGGSNSSRRAIADPDTDSDSDPEATAAMQRAVLRRRARRAVEASGSGAGPSTGPSTGTGTGSGAAGTGAAPPGFTTMSPITAPDPGVTAAAAASKPPLHGMGNSADDPMISDDDEDGADPRRFGTANQRSPARQRQQQRRQHHNHHHQRSASTGAFAEFPIGAPTLVTVTTVSRAGMTVSSDTGATAAAAAAAAAAAGTAAADVDSAAGRQQSCVVEGPVTETRTFLAHVVSHHSSSGGGGIGGGGGSGGGDAAGGQTRKLSEDPHTSEGLVCVFYVFCIFVFLPLLTNQTTPPQKKRQSPMTIVSGLLKKGVKFGATITSASGEVSRIELVVSGERMACSIFFLFCFVCLFDFFYIDPT